MKYSSAMAYLPLDVPPGRRRLGPRVLLQRLAGALREVLRDGHRHGDQQVTGGPVPAGHAPAAYPQNAPTGRTGRHRDGHRAVERRYGQVDPVDRLREGDRYGQGEVVAVPAVQRILTHLDQDVQVAGRPTTGTGLTPAGEPDLLPVGHPGRDPYVERPGLGDPARTMAFRALDVDDRADALALPAWLGEAERALIGGDQAGAVADRAGTGDRPGLGPAAVAGVADPGRAQGQRQGRAVDRVAEVQQDLGLHVPAAGRAAPPGGPATAGEDRTEQVGEAGPAEPAVAGRVGGGRVAEDVREVEGGTAAGARPTPERAGAEKLAHLVVLFALAVVGEHVVRLGDRLEAVL